MKTAISLSIRSDVKKFVDILADVHKVSRSKFIDSVISKIVELVEDGKLNFKELSKYSIDKAIFVDKGAIALIPNNVLNSINQSPDSDTILDFIMPLLIKGKQRKVSMSVTMSSKNISFVDMDVIKTADLIEHCIAYCNEEELLDGIFNPSDDVNDDFMNMFLSN